MQVVMVKHEGKLVGWKLVAETEEDRLKLGSIRDMCFWGFDETYYGVTTWDEDKRYAQTLEWRKKGFRDVKII